MTHLPTESHVVASASTFWPVDQWTANFVMDKPIQNFFDLYSLGDTSGNELKSIGTGNVDMAEIASSEICGLTLDTSATDSYGVLWTLPLDIDTAQDIEWRIIWSSSSTNAAHSAQFALIYTAITSGTTALAVGATALDTVIADDTNVATANAMQASPWGTLSGGTVTALTPGDDHLALHLACTFTTLTDATMYYGQVRYSRKYLA